MPGAHRKATNHAAATQWLIDYCRWLVPRHSSTGRRDVIAAGVIAGASIMLMITMVIALGGSTPAAAPPPPPRPTATVTVKCPPCWTPATRTASTPPAPSLPAQSQ